LKSYCQGGCNFVGKLLAFNPLASALPINFFFFISDDSCIVLIYQLQMDACNMQGVRARQKYALWPPPKNKLSSILNLFISSHN
jgi:hypothetical protein